MKPYAQTNLTDRKRIFNYRLSIMRRISENVFRIWASRFRVFTTPMGLAPDKAVTITLATIDLHNMLRTKAREVYTNENALDKENQDRSIKIESWRTSNISHLQNMPKSKQNHSKKSAESIRDAFADHFYGPRQIPWQWNVLLLHISEMTNF